MLKANKGKKMGKKFIKRDFSEKEYIPREWVDEKKPLKFKFKPLTNKELAYVEDLYSKYDLESAEVVSAIKTVDYKIGKQQLVGWENLIVEDKEVEFDLTILDTINIMDELVELGKYIYVISKQPKLEIKF